VLSGDFTVESLLTLLPFADMTLCYSITGAKIKEALEAGCSKWPAENGGFPTISGMRAVVTGGKVVSLKLDNGDDVEDERKYVVVTKSFLADGKDGYDCLKGHCELLMDVDCAILLSSLVRSALMTANALLLLRPRPIASMRFIDKLRHKDNKHMTLHSVTDGRLVVS